MYYNPKEIGKEWIQKCHKKVWKFRSFRNSFWSIFMWNKTERTFALDIFFRFSYCRTHLLLSIVPADAQKSSLEIRRNFMRAAWRLRGRKFPLWHTLNSHEHNLHCFSFILSIIHFWIKPKAIEIKLFEVCVHNGKNELFFWIWQNVKSTLHLENMTVVIPRRGHSAVF